MPRELIDDVVGHTKRAFEDFRRQTEGVTEELALEQPHPEVKTIHECVLHVAAVKLRHAACAFGTEMAFDWDKRQELYPTFADACRALDDAHALVFKHLCAAQDDRELHRFVKDPSGENVRLRQVFETLICHDVYHCGQMALLRQLVGLP